MSEFENNSTNFIWLNKINWILILINFIKFTIYVKDVTRVYNDIILIQ